MKKLTLLICTAVFLTACANTVETKISETTEQSSTTTGEKTTETTTVSEITAETGYVPHPPPDSYNGITEFPSPNGDMIAIKDAKDFNEWDSMGVLSFDFGYYSTLPNDYIDSKEYPELFDFENKKFLGEERSYSEKYKVAKSGEKLGDLTINATSAAEIKDSTLHNKTPYIDSTDVIFDGEIKLVGIVYKVPDNSDEFGGPGALFFIPASNQNEFAPSRQNNKTNTFWVSKDYAINGCFTSYFFGDFKDIGNKFDDCFQDSNYAIVEMTFSTIKIIAFTERQTGMNYATMTNVKIL